MSSRQVLKKVIPVEDAISVLQDNDVLATSGYGLCPILRRSIPMGSRWAYGIRRWLLLRQSVCDSSLWHRRRWGCDLWVLLQQFQSFEQLGILARSKLSRTHALQSFGVHGQRAV